MRIGLIGIFAGAALMVIGAVPASSKTCTERQQVCMEYCGKNHSKSGKCTSTCADTFAQCKVDGCWASQIVAKQCGFTKQ